MDPNQAAQKKSAGFPLIFIPLLLAIGLGILGYYLGISQSSDKKLATVPNAAIIQPQTKMAYAGLQKAQNSIKTGGEVLGKTQITQVYTGKLVSFLPEKSWVLAKKGINVTISNLTGNKINYFIRPNGWTGATVASETTPTMKIGDTIMIQTSQLATEENAKIDKITLVILPVTTPSSSPTKP